MVPDIDSIIAHVVSFIPTRDVVPQVDVHAGTVQHTLCDRQNPMHCHMIGAMVCDLLQRCGDGRTDNSVAGGARFSDCEYEEKTDVSDALREGDFPVVVQGWFFGNTE